MAEALKETTYRRNDSWRTSEPGKRFPLHKILKGKTALYELTDEEMSAMARCLPNELGNMSPLDKALSASKSSCVVRCC